MYIPYENKINITYVSVYYILKETPHYIYKEPDEWCPDVIVKLLETGIQLCLYVSPDVDYDHIYKRWECMYPNLKIMPYRIDYKDTWIHKECCKVPGLELPSSRNLEKDTYEYLVYNHSKIELMEDAISENPWNSTHFAWIDFHLARLFRKDETLEWLGILGRRHYASKLMLVPGCWEKYTNENVESVSKSIYWRFCGGFFMGDEESILEFVGYYRTHFFEFLQKYKTLTWEVNFWAWLEKECGWKPDWYRGDHNDTILYISADHYTVPLSPMVTSRQKYNYLEIKPYLPSSASYVYFNGLHILNTRYVNYWMYPNGYYLFHNPQNVIENKNVFSILDAQSLTPLNYLEMQPVYLDMEGNPLSQPNSEKHAFSEGLEDIRLYVNGNKLRFICTNVNFSPNGRNRIIIGDYDIEKMIFRNCMVVHPPKRDSYCEKNWIPLVDSKGEEWFIYKWYPMEIGKIDVDTHALEIKRCYDIKCGLFSKVRGSSTFVEWVDKEYLVGLVHFSEEHHPRHYYHMLIMLEKETFIPVKYTNTFCFEKLTIEFSIGMKIVNGEYVFWISQFDRDPMCIRVDVKDIPFVFMV